MRDWVKDFANYRDCNVVMAATARYCSCEELKVKLMSLRMRSFFSGWQHLIAHTVAFRDCSDSMDCIVEIVQRHSHL